MTDITLDPAAAAATADQWREYADQVEQHGQRQHVPIGELPSLLGDVYGEYVEAKIGEYQARQAAYQRVATQAREHARKLETTRQTFVVGDEDCAQRIGQIIE